jgi:hypothetical protein
LHWKKDFSLRRAAVVKFSNLPAKDWKNTIDEIQKKVLYIPPRANTVV